MARVINFTGEPSSGKSTAAYALYAHLKQQGYRVAMVEEHSKKLAYQGGDIMNQDQMYVFAQQQNLMFLLENEMSPNSGKLDYIITDSPLYLSVVYGKRHQNNQQNYNMPIQLPESFFQMVMDTYNQYDNVNILMTPMHQFAHNEGRFHNVRESSAIRQDILNLLQDEHMSSMIFMTKDMNDPNFNLGKEVYDACLSHNFIKDLKVLRDIQFHQTQLRSHIQNAIVTTYDIIQQGYYDDGEVREELHQQLDKIKLFNNNDFEKGLNQFEHWFNQKLNTLDDDCYLQCKINILDSANNHFEDVSISEFPDGFDPDRFDIYLTINNKVLDENLQKVFNKNPNESYLESVVTNIKLATGSYSTLAHDDFQNGLTEFVTQNSWAEIKNELNQFLKVNLNHNDEELDDELETTRSYRMS